MYINLLSIVLSLKIPARGTLILQFQIYCYFVICATNNARLSFFLICLALLLFMLTCLLLFDGVYLSLCISDNKYIKDTFPVKTYKYMCNVYILYQISRRKGALDCKLHWYPKLYNHIRSLKKLWVLILIGCFQTIVMSKSFQLIILI